MHYPAIKYAVLKRKETGYGVLVQEACVVKIKGVTSIPYTENMYMYV